MEHFPYSLDADACSYKHRLYGEVRGRGCNQWYAEKAAIRLAYEAFCKSNKFDGEYSPATSLEKKAIQHCLNRRNSELIE